MFGNATAKTVVIFVVLSVVSPALAVVTAEQKIAVDVSPARVGVYQTADFVIHAPTEYQNPFNPAEVELALVLKTPGGGESTVPAYFCQDHERRRVSRGGRAAEWLYPVGPPRWRGHFTPVQPGPYSAVARLKDGNGMFQSAPVSFECTPSDRKGFLRVGRRDPRYFEFTSGEPFFAIGQNLAFIGEGQYVTLSKAEEIFGRLADSGANFLRIWTGCEDWALAIEARKSAWGRSWSWNPPFVPSPGDEGRIAQGKCVRLAGQHGAALSVSPSHPLAVRPQTGYVFSGKFKAEGDAKLRVDLGGKASDTPFAAEPTQPWTNFRQEFATAAEQWWLEQITLRLDGSGAILLSDLSLRETAGGPELLWEADVNRPIRGHYNQVDCAMLDHLVDSAEEHGIYLQLCLFTRDLYMGALKNDQSDEYRQAIADAKNLLRYAVARWGHSPHVAAWEYFNEIDPNLPTDRFYQELGEYLDEIDVYDHLRTTSTWHPSPKDWRHAKLDIAEMHHYLRPASGESWKDEVAVLLEKAALMKKETPRRPTLIGEFGLADDKWGLSPYMKQDADLVHFHNSLWASALSGTAGTAMSWWWDQLDRQDCYHQYRPLARFLGDVPFATAGLKETVAKISRGQVRVIGLQGADRAYLWLCDSQATWWKVIVDKVALAEIREAEIEVPGLPDGKYNVQWWDTRSGTIVKQDNLPHSRGELRLSVPTFSRDIACKILPGGSE